MTSPHVDSRYRGEDGLTYLEREALFESTYEALVQSEVRILAAQIRRFEDEINQIKRTAADTVIAKERYDTLFSGFSAQLELASESIERRTSGRYHTSAKKLVELYSAARTYLEEGILGWESDVHKNAQYTLQLIQNEFKLAKEMDLPSDLSLEIPELSIEEFDPKRLTTQADLLAELEEICNRLVVDTRLNYPQEGFGRHVTAQELSSYIEESNTRLFVPYLGNTPIGLYIVSSELNLLPKESVVRAQAVSAEDHHGSVAIVGISKAGRQMVHRAGLSAYNILTRAVAETARGMGTTRLWGEVRVGENQNIARKSHLREGWQPSGIVTEHEENEYELIFLDTFSLQTPTYFGQECQVDSGLINQFFSGKTSTPAESRSIAQLAQDFSFTEEIDFSSDTDQAQRALHYYTKLRTKLDNTSDVTYAVENSCLIFSIHSEAKSFRISQKAPGKDLWKVEDIEFYEKGLNQPMRTFDEILETLSDQ